MRNSYQPYSSLKEFLEEKEYSSNDYFFTGIFIENDKIYYETLDKLYTLENIPYSFLICNVIQYELIFYSEPGYELVHWSRVLNYLLFTPFPVLKILEENNFIKPKRRYILTVFSMVFDTFQRLEKSKIKNFFFNSVRKITSDSLVDSLIASGYIIESPEEKLYKILLYSEIPEKKAKALTEKSFVIKDFSVIDSYYKELFESYRFSDYTKE